MKKCILLLLAISLFYPCLVNAADTTYYLNGYSLSHRIYENGKEINRLVIEFVDGANNYVPIDFLGNIKLYDPNGHEVEVQQVVYYEYPSYINGNYDATNGKWNYADIVEYGGYAADINVELIHGKYTLYCYDKDGKEVQYKSYDGGVTYNNGFYFSEDINLPIIPTSSYKYSTDKSGNFIWEWEVPYTIDPSLNTSARVLIDIYDNNDNLLGELYVRVPTHLGRLFVPQNLFDHIKSLGVKLMLGTQIRTNDGCNRGYSTGAELKLNQRHNYSPHR